ncbi:MAG: serine/threonine-protein kinase [bacterium]
MSAPTTSSSEFAELSAALAGQYQIEREIGRGGMGLVYLARDLKLQRRVAIKTLPAHLVGDTVIRERFLREARTAGALSHQNIVPIHRADELDGQVFFVMGFVDGDSMAQRIKEFGRLDPREVVRELHDVALALAYAHAHGVIHRDVKAENILIDRASGRALVTDFGIARLAEATPLTSTGQILGTVYYLSPEQVSGEPVDERSDIYSLGVVGYFALSGLFPFDGELASAVLVAHVTKSAQPLHTVAGGVPHALTDIVDRCLAKNPGVRFQNCGELADALISITAQVESEMRTRDDAPLPTRPALLSDTEAQAIWRRASDLQANTGIQPRSAPIPFSRDRDKDAARTSGYKLADVWDAAEEAGISNQYVEHALAERGLIASPAVVHPVGTLVDRNPDESLLVAGKRRLDFEIVVDGEMPEDDFALLVDIIRHGTGEAGQLSAVGRSFSWQAHPEHRNLHVSVMPRGGKTTIKVSESLNRLVGGIFGGIVGGGGGGSATIWLSIALKMHNIPAGLLMWGGALAVTYASARAIYGKVSRSRETQLRSLTEALAAQARESIAAASPKLDRPPTRRLRS